MEDVSSHSGERSEVFHVEQWVAQVFSLICVHQWTFERGLARLDMV